MTQPIPQQPQPPAPAPTMAEPTYPMVVHMISNPMFPPEPEVGANGQPTGRPGKEEPVHWVISKDHPFVPNFKVLRMFRGGGGDVDVYSVSTDNRIGMRDIVLAHNVRLVQESMPMDIFIEELAYAEQDDDDDDLDDPDLPEQPEPPEAPQPAQAPAANGQPS